VSRKRVKWDDAKDALLRRFFSEGMTAAEVTESISAEIGVRLSVGAVNSRKTELGVKCLRGDARRRAISGRGDPGLRVEESGDSRVLTLRSSTVRTLEGALAEAKVDLGVWEVDRFTVNKWDQGQKREDGGAQVVELWQVKVWLKRVAPKPIVDAFEALCERLPAARPSRAPRAKVTDPHLLELALFDAHFGKLCWGQETGSPYDVKIAARVYANAVDDLLARVAGYPIERVLYPIGEDFFQVDNWIGTTVKGTPVDTDGRFQRTFETGVDAVTQSIERCLRVAPVKVIWVPGNHDKATSWYLAKVVQAYFRDDPRVVVNASPRSRKYHRYGTSLIGFTHGDEEPHRDLPTIMASEEPAEWAAVTCREWHVGHYHKKKETRYNAGDSFGAVGVRVLPSLSGTDDWHYKKGYVKTLRAAEAYLWSREEGYVGHFSVNVREGAAERATRGRGRKRKGGSK
jgi:hypothetical protein